MSRAATVIAVLGAITLVIASAEKRIPQQLPLPGLPESTRAIPEWLPGVWQTSVYALEENSLSRVGAFGSRYRFAVGDDGSPEVARWQEILPTVEVAFYDSTNCVLQERWAGEVREFSLDLQSMMSEPVGPMLTGVLRVADEEDPEPRFYRVVWLKLRDDFFQSPL